VRTLELPGAAALVRANCESAFKFCVEIFHSLVDFARPGIGFQEYSEFYRKKVEARGSAYRGVVFHTAGASGEGPRMGQTRPDENGDRVIRPGMVFTIKPRFSIAGIETPSAQFGDAVLITAKGAERLGRREPEVITLGISGWPGSVRGATAVGQAERHRPGPPRRLSPTQAS
jgi:Xaa-Pro aminopeptidase